MSNNNQIRQDKAKKKEDSRAQCVLQFEGEQFYYRSIKDVGKMIAMAVSPHQDYIVFSDYKGIIDIQHRKKLLNNQYFYIRMKTILKLEKPSNYIKQFSFSSDQKYLLGVDDKNQVYVWNFKKYQLITIFKDRTICIYGANFIPNEEKIIYFGESFLIKVWDLSMKQHTGNLRGHSTLVTCFASSKSEMIGASGSQDGVIVFWDLKSYRKTFKMKAHTQSMVSLDFSIDSNKFLSVSYYEIKIWNLKSYTCLFTTFMANNLQKRGIFSNDNKYFITTCKDSLSIWDNKSYQCIKTFQTDILECVDILPEKNIIVTGNLNKSINFYSLTSFSELSFKIQEPYDKVGQIISNSLFQDEIVIGVKNGFEVFIKATGKCIFSQQLPQETEIVGICTQDKYCIIQSKDKVKTFYLYDIQNKRICAKRRFPKDTLYFAGFCNDNKNLIFKQYQPYGEVQILNLEFKVIAKRKIPFSNYLIACNTSNKFVISKLDSEQKYSINHVYDFRSIEPIKKIVVPTFESTCQSQYKDTLELLIEDEDNNNNLDGNK